MTLRTLLVSDTFAYSFLQRRPAMSWEPYAKGYRDRAIVTPEYGLMYVAAALKAAGVAYSVVNVVADRWDDVRWFEVSDEHVTNERARKELERLVDRMKASLLDRVRDADVVMVPMSYYYMVRGVKRIIGDIRRANPVAVLIVGGIYASVHASELVRDGTADVVVRGEGEDTILSLLAELEQGRRPSTGLETLGITYRSAEGRLIRNANMPRIDDLDRLPHLYTAGEDFRVARRHHLLKTMMPEGDYFVGSSFLTSRGCPERCTFCMDQTIWKGKVRFHSPRYVRDVVQFCWDRYHRIGEPRFFFGDATFTLRKQRLYELGDAIAGIGWSYNVQTRADAVDEETLLRMKACGFRSLAFGGESLNDEILEHVVLKRQTSRRLLDSAALARTLGLDPVLTFIAGLPGESKESHLRTVRLLREAGLTDATFFPLVVFRGTPLYDRLVAGTTPEEIERARLDVDSEEFCFPTPEFPTKEDLFAWVVTLNASIREESGGGGLTIPPEEIAG